MTRALVVDDNAAVRLLVSRVLEALGCEVRAAGDAEQALRLAAESTVDLLVTDVSLGDGTGLRVAEGVRRLHADARVLYVSGHEPGDVARMAEGEGLASPGAGPTERFLRKPFGLAELREAAGALLFTSSCPPR